MEKHVDVRKIKRAIEDANNAVILLEEAIAGLPDSAAAAETIPGESLRLREAEKLVRDTLARGDGAAEESVQEVLTELERLRRVNALKEGAVTALECAREEIVLKSDEIHALRSRYDVLDAQLERERKATKAALEENARLAALLVRKDEGDPAPVDWPSFPENTMLRLLSTYAPSGFIDLAVVEGDTPAALVKRLVSAVTAHRRAAAESTGVRR